MRIAFFSDTYHPYVSGVIASMDSFRKHLEERGHEVFVLVPEYPEKTRKGAKAERVLEMFSLPVPGYDRFRIATPISRDDFRDLNFDVVHTHSPFIMGRIGARFAERRDIPLIFTCHSLYPEYSRYFSFLDSVVESVIEDYVVQYCNRCDLVLSPSHHVNRVLKEWGVRSSLEVMPTGVEVGHFQSGDHRWARERFGIPKDRNLLLFVGRLGKEKNLAFLIRSFALLQRDDGLSHHLLLVGDGPERERLRELAQEEGVASRVTFAGELGHDKVIDCYHGADLFVFPSRVETQGLVLVEAMAAGLPVVAVEAAATEEVVVHGRHGLVVSPHPEDFASAVNRLATGKELRQKMQRYALQRAEDFSTDRLSDKLEDIYMRMVRR